MEKSALHQQILSLPDLVRALASTTTVGHDSNLWQHVDQTFPPELCRQVNRVYITGCGDSHHAALNAALAFEQLAGIPCEALTAMQFSRYTAPYLANNLHDNCLVIGVSVSGQVSRTIEAVELARQAGALTTAVTGNAGTPLGTTADLVITARAPAYLQQATGMIVPGARSYIASQLALFILAVHLGWQREHLSANQADRLQLKLVEMAGLMEQTIAECDSIAQQAALDWHNATHFVYCGSGPNFGTAAFSAAKLLEASGDVAIAQDVEEWAHLQYFAREKDTPTILISAAKRDVDRLLEIATAATQIGRRVAIVAPATSQLAHFPQKQIFFPLAGKPPECFSSLLSSIPGLLFASYRTQDIGESHFRDFGGGRNIIGGGGISRIRDSHRIQSLAEPVEDELL